MMISSSKVSGMVNFLSTVNIGKLSKKKKKPSIASDYQHFYVVILI